ncbi:MAG: hypothetical protein VYA30_13510 [Myxococcota bacterium]|nr:hypothetical protein [Myxococcota bacterium]
MGDDHKIGLCFLLILFSSTLPVNAERYHVKLDTVLNMDRWYSGYEYMVETTDINHRLRLHIFEGTPGDESTITTFDMAISSDIGPEADAYRQWGSGRRTNLEIYQGSVTLLKLVPRSRIKLGRQIFWDALGAGAFDGISLQTTPFSMVHLTGRFGQTLRPNTARFGYFLPSPVTGERRRRGYLIAGRLRLEPMDALHGEFGYRRHFNDQLQREEISASARVQPAPWSSNTVLICADLIFEQISEWRLLTEFAWEQNRIALEAAYLRPRFDADSIWVAFAPAPHHSASVNASKFMGKIQLGARIDGTLFQTDFDSLEPFNTAHWAKENTATRGSLFVNYRLSRGGVPSGSMGIQGHISRGYGGQFTAVSTNTHIPLANSRSFSRVSIRSRLGVAQLSRDSSLVWSGLSSWGLVGVDWRPDDGVLSQLAVEGFSGMPESEHIRIFLAVRMENFW